MPKKGASNRGVLKPKAKKEVRKIAKQVVAAAIIDKQATYNFTANVGTAGIVLPIGLMIKGDSAWQRQGAKIRCKSIHTRGQIKGDSTAAVMRVIHGVYKEPNGVLPTVTEILQSVSAAGALSVTYKSPYNYNNRQGFTIKSDKSYALSGFTTTTNGAALTSFSQEKFAVLNEYHKMSNNIVYTQAGDAGTIADVDSGLPFICLVSDNNTNLATYDLGCTLSFENAA